MFTEEYGTIIKNEDKKISNKKKFENFLNFVTSKELYKKSTFLKIARQPFEAGDSLNIFLRFFL